MVVVGVVSGQNNWFDVFGFVFESWLDDLWFGVDFEIVYVVVVGGVSWC